MAFDTSILLGTYQWRKLTRGNREEIDSAISKFETQMRQLQAAARDATNQSKQDELRFQTVALKGGESKERGGAGQIWRGIQPQPLYYPPPDPNNYTYYTELPSECYAVLPVVI